MLPAAETSTATQEALLQQSSACSQSPPEPEAGSSSTKKRGSWSQLPAGFSDQTTNSSDTSTVWKRGHARPRKHAVSPIATHCQSGTMARGRGRPSHGGPVDEGRRAMVARPPRLRFHSAEVSPEFIVWSENPAGT